MNALRNLIDKIKPTFSEGGKLSMFRSVFDGFETFLFVPNETSKPIGAQIHDAVDSKRIMIMVVIALIPPLVWYVQYRIPTLLSIGQLATTGFFLCSGMAFYLYYLKSS